MSGIGKIVYIKISRTDGNGTDITNSLESLESIVMPLSTGNKAFNILNRTRENEYYLFYVSMTGTEDIPAIDKSSPHYSFSGSYDGFIPVFRGQPPVTSSVDNLNFFIKGGTTSSLGDDQNTNFFIGSYRPTTLPAKNLGITVSSSLEFLIEAGKDTTTSVTASVRILSNPLTPGVVPQNPTVLAESVITQSTQDLDVSNMEFTGSYELSTVIPAGDFNPGDCIYFDLKATGDNGTIAVLFANGKFTNSIFEISSSSPVVNPKSLSIEPYLTSPFYGTDCDVTYGNVSQGIPNPLIQDLDYQTSITQPVNLELIISGTAAKATIPESYYTSLAQINPRYLGSKSECSVLNSWSRGDWGTYGKLPNIQSLGNLMLYCDWIGGNPPERMDTSVAHVKFIIFQDGTVMKPNLTSLGLSNIQNAFVGGENLNVALASTDASMVNSLSGLRRIVKGGAKITPILSTQSGSVTGDPILNFGTNPISITSLDPNLQPVGRFNFQYTLSSQFIGTAGASYSNQEIIEFPTKVYNYGNDLNIASSNGESLWKDTYYTSTPNSQLNGVENKLAFRFYLENTNSNKNQRQDRKLTVELGYAGGNDGNQSKGILVDQVTGEDLTHLVEELYISETAPYVNGATNAVGPNYMSDNLFANNQYRRLILWAKGRANQWNNEWRAKALVVIKTGPIPYGKKPQLNLQYWQNGGADGVSKYEQSGKLWIFGGAFVQASQTPPPDIEIDTAATANASNLIWSLTSSYVSDTGSLPGTTTFTLTSSAEFYQYYGSDYYQETVSGWGFDEITNPMVIEPGDEFRFMGVEKYVFTVDEVEEDTSGNSGAGSIKVKFNKHLPISQSYQVSGTNATLQWDWFVVRRYIDDASYVIFEAIKPSGASGTSLVSPQFKVSELDKNIDEIVLDLTDKGLID